MKHLHSTKLNWINLTSLDEVKAAHDADCVIVAVAHDEFKALGTDGIDRLYKPETDKVLIDVKGLFDRQLMEEKAGYYYWRL